MLTVKIVALLTAAVLVAGPATVVYKKTRVFVLVPPEQILPGVKKVAVLDFAGQGADGRSFADVLTSKLFEKQRGIQDIRTTSLFGAIKHTQEGKTLQQGAFTDVFTLIERSRLAQVLQEQRLAQSGLLDEAQAAQVGKILGVDAIVVGTVSFGDRSTVAGGAHVYREPAAAHAVRELPAARGPDEGPCARRECRERPGLRERGPTPPHQGEAL